MRHTRANKLVRLGTTPLQNENGGLRYAYNRL